MFLSGPDWRGSAGLGLPPAEEITRLRALISRVTASLDDLPDTERAGIDHAVALVRRHRAVMLGMPRRAGNGDQERTA